MSRDDYIVVYKIINPKRNRRTEPRYLYVVKHVQGELDYVRYIDLANVPFEIFEHVANAKAHQMDRDVGETEYGVISCGIYNVYVGGVRDADERASIYDQEDDQNLVPLDEGFYAQRIRECTRNPRLRQLIDAFARKGLFVREDSALCTDYIKRGAFPALGIAANCANKLVRSPDEIAEVFEVLDFFYTRTRYAELRKILVNGGPNSVRDDAFAKIVSLIKWVDDGNNVAELPYGVIDTVLAWSMMFTDNPISCIKDCISKCRLNGNFTDQGVMHPYIRDHILLKYRV